MTVRENQQIVDRIVHDLQNKPLGELLVSHDYLCRVKKATLAAIAREAISARLKQNEEGE